MAPPGGAADAPDVVEVTIPPKPGYVSVARLTAATVAARHSFTYDEIEDLKIAVSEACTAFIVRGTGGLPLTLRFTIEPDALEIGLETGGEGLLLDAAPAAGHPLDERRLGVFLMQCLVDEVEVPQSAGGRVGLRLLKRRQA